MDLTLLNSMAGPDLPVALDRHVALGLRFVDLKDRIWERKIEDLDEAEAARLDALLRERGLAVHCLSSGLGWMDVGVGESAWRAAQDDLLQKVLRVAQVLHPRYVRILGIRFGTSSTGVPSFREAAAAHPWLTAAYAGLIRKIADAGYAACLENEAKHCALATPDDVVAFFSTLQPLLGGVSCDYIWDVQNMWQMGCFPSLEGYAKLRPFLRLLHLKGGRADAEGKLAEACGLREASWPVLPILAEVYWDRRVEMICLNPSHGKRPESYDIWRVAQDDIAFLREHLARLGGGPRSAA